MNQENHEIKSLGPQVFLETGSDKMEDSGRAVYKFAAVTKDKRRNNITFHETGFARYYTENEFQVEVGITGKSNENNYRTIVHKGHYCVNADKGEIKLKAINGEEVTIKKVNGIVYINEAEVVTADIVVSNGVIHFINRVLQPLN